MKAEVVFVTCWKYRDLWPLISRSAQHLFENMALSSIAVSDSFGNLEPPAPTSSLKFVKSDDGSFTARLQKALEQCRSPYVLLMLDDYYVPSSAKFSMDEYIELMEQYDIQYLRLFKTPSKGKTVSPQLVRLVREQKYAINTHASVWNKNALMAICSDYPNLSPWEFEILFNEHHDILQNSVYRSKKDFFPFIELLVGGKYVKSAKKIVEADGLPCTFREDMSSFSFWLLNAKKTIREHLPVWVQKRLPTRRNGK